jgi:hypothetical protein
LTLEIVKGKIDLLQKLKYSPEYKGKEGKL